MKKIEIYLYKFLAILLLFMTLIQVANGQAQSKKVQPIKIGEKVPDFLFKKVLQYGKPALSLGELKGKAVILDIWSVGCGPCIAAFPKMEKLQKLFGNELLILPVSVSLEAPTVKFLNNRKGTAFEMKLPTVVYDIAEEKSFKALFPFYGIPHEIWIDKDGILRATTDETFVNEAIISKFLKGLPINWTMQTFDPNFKEGDILFAENKENLLHSVLYKSSIAGVLDGIQAPAVFFKDSTMTRITIPNVTLLELVKTTLRGEIFYRGENTYVHSGDFDTDVYNKQLLIKSKNADKFFMRSSGNDDTTYSKWLKQNAKSYELILPSNYTWDDAFIFMKQDLERFFKIEISVQQLPVKYLALIKKDNYDDSIESNMDQKDIYKMADDESSLMLQNRPVALLTSYIEERNFQGPIIKDETGIKGNINISLALDKNRDYRQYNVKLNSLGLALTEKTALMPVLVISDK